MAGFEVTITFSEPVEGFELEDIRVTNGTASNFTKVSPQEYTAEITPSASGAVKWKLRRTWPRTAAGNGNRAAEPSRDRGGPGAARGNDRRTDGAGGNGGVRSDDHLLGAGGGL